MDKLDNEINTKNNSKRNKSQSNLKLTPKEQLKNENRPRVLSKGKNLPPIMAMTSNNFHHPIYYQTLDDHLNISSTDWEKQPDGSEKRKISYILLLKNIPFIKEGNVTSEFTTKCYKDLNIYEVISSSQTFGIPMGDFFAVQDIVEIYPLTKNSCVAKFFGYAKIIKDNILKGMLVNLTNKTLKETNDKWIEYIKSKGIILKDIKINENDCLEI